MPVLARALCLAGIAAAAPAQTVSVPVTLQAAPRVGPAQTNTRATLPPGAAARDARLRAETAPDMLQWADRTAAKKPTPEAIRTDVVNSWPDLSQAGSEDLVFIVMMAAARDSDADLRSDLATMRGTTTDKQSQRGQAQGQGTPSDSLSELSDMQSLRLQMELDRRSKLMAALSSLMKKADETETSVVQNIK